MRVLAVLLFTVALNAETINVRVRETTVVKFARATAAYAIDPSIADAVARGGEVSVTGRGTGETRVVVVTGDSQLTFDVDVAAPQANAPRAKHTGVDGRVEMRYQSADRQAHAVIDVGREEGTRRTEVHVESVHYGADARYRAQTTLPSVSYRITTPGRELTFFDRNIDQSPLTVSNTSVRGLHFIGERWRVHAGTTAFTAYQSFLLPTASEKVAGAAYALPLSPSSSLTPSAFVTSNGSIASMLYDYRPDDHLFARGELAFSRGLGAAAQFGLDRQRDRVRLDVRYRPRDFATISPGELRGLVADASWSKTFGRGSQFETAFSKDQYALTSTTNAHVRINDSLAFLGGANYGSFAGTHSLTVPAGVQLDFNRFGASAVGKWSNRGLGFRLSTRASLGRVYASAYVDYQQQAPTLALILREDPQLALELEELGITATSPADIARALRENSTLIALGYVDGVTIDLSPARTQAGVELAWLGARTQVRARLLAQRFESVKRSHETVIGTLTVSRRVTPSMDLFAGYTYWESDGVRRPQMELGFRQRFDELPSLSRGRIAGRVTSPVPVPVPVEVEVELDGGERVTPSRDGSFAFARVGSGPHRVSARIVDASDAYFTGPSRVDAKAGDFVTFEVAKSPAHLRGRIVSDAGAGVGGVALALTRGANRMQTTSATDGSFSIDAAPGEWELTVDTLSLPAGFSIGKDAQSVMLVAAQPATVAFTVRANRSISGRAPAGVQTVTVEQLGLHVPVDANGRFTIRSLPAGAITLRAGKKTSRVLLPREPAVLTASF